MSDTITKPLRATVQGAREEPLPPGRLSALLMKHGSMELRWYTPRSSDQQTPHDQDELYVINKGTGQFLAGRRSTPFGPGDVLFVPAGETHRFENFSDDLELWVIFWGQVGGEKS